MSIQVHINKIKFGFCWAMMSLAYSTMNRRWFLFQRFSILFSYKSKRCGNSTNPCHVPYAIFKHFHIVVFHLTRWTNTKLVQKHAKFISGFFPSINSIKRALRSILSNALDKLHKNWQCFLLSWISQMDWVKIAYEQLESFRSQITEDK